MYPNPAHSGPLISFPLKLTIKRKSYFMNGWNLEQKYSRKDICD
jgi:hypothetical protein